MIDRHPVLSGAYEAYLTSHDSAAFVAAVGSRYLISTLERLAEFGSCPTRRAAVVALHFLSDYQSQAVLGRRLRDTDRAVRVLAEHGIVELWRRWGNERQRHRLSDIIRRNMAGQCDLVIREATEFMEEAPGFAEVWNQRAIAFYHCADYERAVEDCRQTLLLNAYHFPAAVGLANCYLELDDAFTALEAFRLADKLNPDMEDVRAQIRYLQRVLEEK